MTVQRPCVGCGRLLIGTTLLPLPADHKCERCHTVDERLAALEAEVERLRAKVDERGAGA